MSSSRFNQRSLIVCSFVVVIATMSACQPMSPSEVTDSKETTSGLIHNPDVFRYRHSTTPPDVDAQETTAIAVLEERLREISSPFDAAELAEIFYRRAQRNADRRDYERSEELARRSIELKGQNAHLTLAKLANARHQFREAIEIAREQLKIKSTVSGHLVLATAHLALGEPALAVTAATNALAVRPDSGAHLMRALALEAQGRDAEATFDFTRAVALESDGDLQGAARLRTLWGRFLLRRGEHLASAMVLGEALRILPGYPLAIANRAELELRIGKPVEAAKLFEQAFMASRQVRYLIDQARAQELTGDRAGANVLRTEAEAMVRHEIEVDGLGHTLELVEILVDRGDLSQMEEAVRLAREELARRPSFAVRFQLARALTRSKLREEAMRVVDDALAMGTREAQLYELASHLQLPLSLARGEMYSKEADKLDPARAGWRAQGIGEL